MLRHAQRLYQPRTFKALPRRLWVGGGSPQAVDERIWPDAVWLLETNELRVTAARAGGHNTHGDGTAMDMVHASGRGWDDTAKRAAEDLGWTEGCGGSGTAPVCPLVPAIQFIGYNGYEAHGDPAHVVAQPRQDEPVGELVEDEAADHAAGRRPSRPTPAPARSQPAPATGLASIAGARRGNSCRGSSGSRRPEGSLQSGIGLFRPVAGENLVQLAGPRLARGSRRPFPSRRRVRANLPERPWANSECPRQPRNRVEVDPGRPAGEDVPHRLLVEARLLGELPRAPAPLRGQLPNPPGNR